MEGNVDMSQLEYFQCQLTHEPVHTTPRHCEERHEGEKYFHTINAAFEISERRGNLPALNSSREVLSTP